MAVNKSDGDLISDPTKVNKLGSLLSKVPLSPKFAKMLVVALKYNLAHYTVMIVACLSVAEIYKEAPRIDQTGENDQGIDPEMDPDLITSIDRDRGNRKRQKVE